MTGRTDAAGTAAFTWDTAGRLLTERDPLTQTTRTVSWNAASEPTQVAFSGATAPVTRAYTYDSQGRLVSDTLTTGAAVTLELTRDLGHGLV